jgi:hypothetical protein
VESFGVTPEIDIWRAATLMLKRHGERALEGKRHDRASWKDWNVARYAATTT